MSIRTRLLAAGLVLSATVALPLMAQEEPALSAPPQDAPAAQGKTVPKTYPQYRRVPTYFAQLGLSEQQRIEIYTLRGGYQARIQELDRQILELKAQEMAECESVLTEAQKKLLDQRRAASGRPETHD